MENRRTGKNPPYGILSDSELERAIESRDVRLNANVKDVIVGYKLRRHDCCGWCFAGVTPSEVAETLKNEMDMHEGLSVEECGVIEIVPYETTQNEIDSLPEFEGW